MEIDVKTDSSYQNIDTHFICDSRTTGSGDSPIVLDVFVNVSNCPRVRAPHHPGSQSLYTSKAWITDREKHQYGIMCLTCQTTAHCAGRLWEAHDFHRAEWPWNINIAQCTLYTCIALYRMEVGKSCSSLHRMFSVKNGWLMDVCSVSEEEWQKSSEDQLNTNTNANFLFNLDKQLSNAAHIKIHGELLWTRSRALKK